MIITKKRSCIEGKLLPAIPIPNTDVDDYPDCIDCGGSGYVDVEGMWVRAGETFKNLRFDKRVSLRDFCKKHKLDPVNVSRVERGLQPADQKIKNAYNEI